MLTLLMFETASKAHEKYSEVISSIRGHSHQKYGSISPGKKSGWAISQLKKGAIIPCLYTRS